MAHRVLDHTADIGLEVEASTLSELFCEALVGMSEILVEQGDVENPVERSIRLEAPDLESLLVDWLTEAIGLFETEDLLLTSAEIEVDRIDTFWRLFGSVQGEPFDADRHCPRTLVKAATYHRLRVDQHPGRWKATIYFDL